jgi:hypothetical protein
LKSARHNFENCLLEMQSTINSLSVEEDFRKIILEDIGLSVTYFKEKNILSVSNVLLALVGKLHTYALFSRCHHLEIEKLLVCIHELQQNLNRLPICIMRPTGATGPAGSSGSRGPMGVTEATGSTIADGKTTIITNSCPVFGFPTSKLTAGKLQTVDLRSHIIE